MVLTKLKYFFTRAEIPALTQYNVCNPSVIKTQSGYLSTVRGCNYNLKSGYNFKIGSADSKVPDSQNYIVEFDDNFELKSYWFLEDRHIRADDRALDGLEDLRLFEYKGQKHVIASALNYWPKPKNVMVMCRIDNGNVLRDPLFLQSPTDAKVEKNWMPWVVGDRLFFVYQTHPLEIYELRNGNIIKILSSPADNWISGLSGSSCVMPYKDGYMSVVHRKTIDQKKRLYFYWHHLVEFDAEMNPKRLGRKFSFEEERVEFCAGLSIEKDNVVFSYGLMDQRAVLLKTKTDILEELF